MQYFGQTKRALKTRFKEHLLKIKKAKKIDTFLLHKSNSTERLKNILRHELELKWITNPFSILI